jgi:enoyl-CoA hydratase
MRASRMACAQVEFAMHSKHVGLLTLNIPEKLNALSVAVGEEFQRVVTTVVAPHRDLRALVVTGAGTAFSAGGDLQFLNDRQHATARENSDEMLRYYDRFLSLRRVVPVPTIAAINGAAVGAGLVLAMTCDMRVVANDAKLGVNFSRIGIHAGLGSTHFLPALLGNQNAAYLLLTGQLVSGVEAREMGLALAAVPRPEVLERALRIAGEVAAASPVAVQATLRTLRARQDEGLPRALQREADSQAHCYAHPDLAEGLAAIKGKRSPHFQ